MGYSADKSVQILISLLKQHNIKKIVISPGTTNICLVGSLQQDSFFECYSCVDERSAAYMACGMAEEGGAPVVLSCTGATASRNYMPGLTEAFYRKLPLLVVTSSAAIYNVGNLYPQVTDRTTLPNDIVGLSVQIPKTSDSESQWLNTLNMNKAILTLTKDGGMPAHINLITSYSRDFSVKELQTARFIKRIGYGDLFSPPGKCNLAIYIGQHSKFTEELTTEIDSFCEKYNAVVLCDQTSNYHGKYRINANLICNQVDFHPSCSKIDLLIHIGNISGAYTQIRTNEVWRINSDGEPRDYFKRLTCVFQMNEVDFFRKCNCMAALSEKIEDKVSYYMQWKAIEENISLQMKEVELPFSNIWCAQKLSGNLSENTVIYLGILNSLRSWNYVNTNVPIDCYSNTGGFGIDGCISTVLGAALASPYKLFICITGDLGFFYDMNACGNRYFPCNIRIILINNGKGTEFRNYSHPANDFGDEADKFMSAGGHFGMQSKTLVKNYAENLGFEYFSAENKNEFISVCQEITTKDRKENPVILEVFTNSEDESDALYIMEHLMCSKSDTFKRNIKAAVKGMIGEYGTETVRKILRGKKE